MNNPDLASLEIIGNDFSKDKTHVYYETNILKSADPQTFRIIVTGEALDEITYTKDKNHVFCENKLLKNANVATFKILGLGYATDGKSVYFHARLVPTADAASFKRLEHEYWDSDAMDKNSKYLAGVKL